VPRWVARATPLDVTRLDDDPSVVARYPMQVAEQSSRLRRRAEETEVVSEQDDRVEPAE
jgi:hypothetical protein